MQVSGIRVRHMGTQARAGQSSPSFDGKLLFPSPDYRDKIVVELVSKKLENYAPAPYGTAHPDTTLYPTHRLVLQAEQDPETAVRYYAADRSDEDWHNASISYSSDSKDHPIFIRDYIVRRTAYAAITRLTALSGLFDSDVTAGGTGYAQETTTASLSGGTGSGGVVAPIVSNGAVIGLVITTQGNYTVAPTVTINSTGSGAGATAAVAVQLQTATLVKEDMLAKTGDERIDSLYVLVRRIYETLPGPWIYDVREDLLLGLVQLKKRAVAVTTPPQTGSVTATAKTVYQTREDSSVVAWEIVETNTDGTGSAGNPAFQVLDEDIYDKPRGPVQIRTQLVVRSAGPGYTEAATLAVAGGVATLTEYKPYEGNVFLLRKVIETWAVPGVDVPAETLDEDGQILTTTRTLALASAITEGETLVSTTWTRTHSEDYSETIRWKVTRVRSVPGAVITEEPKIDDDGNVIIVTRQLIAAGTATTGVALPGNWTRTTEEAVQGSVLVTWKVVESQPISATKAGEERSEEVRGRDVFTTFSKVAAGTDPSSGNLVIRSKVDPIDSVVSRKVDITVASLPPDESWAHWDFVPIPLLIFDINHTIFCNGLAGYKLTTEPVKSGGASALRKHRTTVGYSNTYPNPDLSGSTYAVGSIQYEGKVIQFSFSNVLNDAVSAAAVSDDGTCTWTEAYSFSASTPSATTFAAGAWYVRDYRVEPWGTSGFKSTKVEFFSAAGNPSI